MGVIISIHKKGDKKECSDYRGISLLSLPGKVYAKCLAKWCCELGEPQLEDTQCGFRPGRSTTDQLFTLKHSLKKSWEYPKDVYACFVDHEKAYDRVPRDTLRKVLQEYGIDGSLPVAIKAMDKCPKACVRLNSVQSKPFTVDIGLRQGYVLSPFLFIVYMNWINRHGLGWECVMIGSIRISHLLFSDDLVLLAYSENDLQRALHRFATVCNDPWMKIRCIPCTDHKIFCTCFFRNLFMTFIMSMCVSDLISALISWIFLYRRTWGFDRWDPLPSGLCKV